MTDIESEGAETSLLNLLPSPRQRGIALAIVLALPVAFGITALFASVQLPRVTAFIPTLGSMIFLNDLVTSILLFGQLSVVRSRAILLLATGYLFTALIIIPYALTFPEAFAPTGLLGAGLQSTAWLYIFWHFGFPASVFAYAWLKQSDRSNVAKAGSAYPAIGWNVLIVIGLVCVLAWLATSGERFLPNLFTSETRTGPLSPYVLALDALMALFALLSLWIHRRTLLDLCLMVVICAWITELGLTGLVTNARFSFGFYAGRIFSLMTSVIVLSVLVSESTKLYARLARSNMLLTRERNSKLMNAEATAAAIAHELKQPLAAMVANADASLEFLEQMPPNVARVKEALNDIVADGHRTSEALDGVRTLFRNVNEGREPVDMNEICRDVLHSMRSELNGQGITLQSELTPEIPLVQGNRGQLQQVLFNLAHNAVEAMAITRDRSRVLRLITQRDDRDRIIVAVQDTGPGIDAKRLEEIFDAFVTTKPHGTGLGLAICRIIIERHGGELTAFSDGRSGALFQFALPVGVD